ncbi:hypothetical protein UI24_16210 [Mycobacteroides franklinii]|nr:hypothetical protein [Mycobacteroides franklinii]
MLVSSYAPLLVLLAVLGTWPSWWIRGALLITAALCCLLVWAFFRFAITNRSSRRYVVYQAKPREGEALKFFSSYVVPFFVAITAGPNAKWGLLVYLALLSLLYMRGDLYFTNPLIALFGYRVFELTGEDRTLRIVISKRWYMPPGIAIRLKSLGGYVYIEETESSDQTSQGDDDGSDEQ